MDSEGLFSNLYIFISVTRVDRDHLFGLWSTRVTEVKIYIDSELWLSHLYIFISVTRVDRDHLFGLWSTRVTEVKIYIDSELWLSHLYIFISVTRVDRDDFTLYAQIKICSIHIWEYITIHVHFMPKYGKSSPQAST